MICPKCKNPMKAVYVEKFEVDRCTHCKGLWFDSMEESHLNSLQHVRKLDVGAASLGKQMNQTRDVYCPHHTTTLMTHLRIVDQPHIEIESCPVCYGMFFDAGEFADFQHKSFAETILHWLT